MDLSLLDPQKIREMRIKKALKTRRHAAIYPAGPGKIWRTVEPTAEELQAASNDCHVAVFECFYCDHHSNMVLQDFQSGHRSGGTWCQEECPKRHIGDVYVEDGRILDCRVDWRYVDTERYRENYLDAQVYNVVIKLL